MQQQGQQTGSTEEQDLDEDAKDRQLAAKFQQQLMSDGWDDWGTTDKFQDVPPSPALGGGSEGELSADAG